MACARELYIANIRTNDPDEAKLMEKSFAEGSSVDDDFLPFLDSRPSKIALSMLKSQGRSKKQEQEKQQLIHAEVAEQREAVTAAQWAWFQAALKQDQQMLEKLQVVPALVKSKLHTKAVSKRREQAAAGEKATKGYQDRGLPERV